MTVPHILRRRRARADRARRSLAHRLGRLGGALTLGLALAVALGTLALAFAYATVTRDLPSPAAVPALLEPPDGLLLQPTRIYDRSGTHLLRTLEAPTLDERQYLPLDSQAAVRPIPETTAEGHLPPALAAAFVAFRDPDFWTHPGFRRGKNARPTLTEALVTDLLLYAEPPGLLRTWRARLLAAQLTAQYGREQMLEWVLNSANFGHHIYGAANAARGYLDKDADRLTLSESALLAAVAAAPDLNPWDAPQLALERRDAVLQAMLTQGWITAEQAEAAQQERIRFTTPPPAPADDPLVALALEQASALVPASVLQRGGWRVLTTLDWALQTQAVCLLDYWHTQATSGGLPAESCPAARLLPLPAGGQAAQIVALDPPRGQVLAWAQTGEAEATHPLGTTLTPFLYLTAFTRGKSPASLVWDVPPADPNDILLPNPDDAYHGPMRLRTALANDYLAPAQTLIPQLGVETLARTLNQFGFGEVPRPPLDQAAAIFLGGLERSPLALAQAYGVLANQGVLVAQGDGAPRPLALLRLERLDGRLTWDCDAAPETCGSQRKLVVSPQLAYLITEVLKDEAARWPTLGHPNPLEVGQPLAAKIGRLPDATQGWTAGYTPNLSVVVWAQADAHQAPLRAAGLWRAFIQHALQQRPAPPWSEPPGLSHVVVCETSGMLPTPECPAVVEELFLNGAEPTHRDTLYRTYLVNRETGRLATVFTPPELVEKRVYLVVPPEAAAWAAQAGLPTPPEEYDLVAAPPPNPQVHITTPALFSYVAGRVTILGSARGEGMQFYRLQAGPGLNPQRWTQIGEDATTPVDEGVLGVWDTRGLQGLYTLQLQVVYQDQRVAVATMQVTVDNTPPTVQVLAPADGETLAYNANVAFPLLVDAQDDFGVVEVTFVLNGRRLGTLTEPPYRLPWPMRVGRFTLRVTVRDLAGNTAETQVTFKVSR